MGNYATKDDVNEILAAIEGVRDELGAEIEGVRIKLKDDISEVKKDVENLEQSTAKFADDAYERFNRIDEQFERVDVRFDKIEINFRGVNKRLANHAVEIDKLVAA